MADQIADPLTKSLDLHISGTLPGEALAVAIIALQTKMYENASPELRTLMANDIIAAQHRLHVIWERMLDAMHVPGGGAA